MAKQPPLDPVPDPEGVEAPATVDVLSVAPPLPSFEIAERRAKYGDLDALREVDAAAQLIDQSVPMTTRWIYCGPGAEGRFAQIMAKGWRQIRNSELVTGAALNGWQTSPDGFVTRGEKGHELLVKMPKHLYETIQVRKALDGDAKRRSSHRLRQQTAEALAQDGQQRAADRIGAMQISEFQETADVRKL